jgi:hypothetical protein
MALVGSTATPPAQAATPAAAFWVQLTTGDSVTAGVSARVNGTYFCGPSITAPASLTVALKSTSASGRTTITVPCPTASGTWSATVPGAFQPNQGIEARVHDSTTQGKSRGAAGAILIANRKVVTNNRTLTLSNGQVTIDGVYTCDAAFSRTLTSRLSQGIPGKFTLVTALIRLKLTCPASNKPWGVTINAKQPNGETFRSDVPVEVTTSMSGSPFGLMTFMGVDAFR